MVNRITKFTLLLASVSLVLSACNKSDGAESTPKTTAVTKDWTQEEFEVVFFANNGQKQEEIDFWFGDPLRKKFPKIKFVWLPTKAGNMMPEMIAAGEKFDVFFTTRGTYEQLAYMYDIQYDMTELIKTHQVDLTRIEPILLEEVRRTSGGKIYMLPVQNNIQILFYNKDLFDRFGVEYPRDGMTWDEMLNLSKKLTRKEGDKLFFGFSNQGAYQAFKMNPMSLTKVDPNTEKIMINQDTKWKTMLETFFVQPYQGSAVFQEHFSKSSAPPAFAQFYKDQSTAMTTYIASLLGQAYVDSFLSTFNWDIVSHPTLPGLPNVGTQPDPIYIGMTKLTRNKEATMEVLKYLISDEYQTMMARQSNMTVLSDPNIQKQTGADMQRSGVGKNYAALYKNKMAPLSPIVPKVDLLVVGELTKYANRLAKGEFDTNTMMRMAEDEIQKKIDDELRK